ncbi:MULTISPECIES: hypothetical protein [unclassified Streptomyces]|uniref:hypothetical protein n=1 Tax=unclassified Streptomyces TaxID=2593676 RepID=UPI00052A2828|nr:hypothetical protein [Streptomyces sp. CCM_MD2014]AIV35923.1 hypothetical protein NI25_22610 [Streptomyces sp. CCM_MD2014]
MSASQAVVRRDAVALITGLLDEPADDVDHALDCVLADLSKCEGNALVVAFAGILAAVLTDSARLIDEPVTELWAQYAQQINVIIEQEEEQP